MSACSPAGSKAMARSAARRVDSPTRTTPGGATDWRRDAVLTRSPATIAWPRPNAAGSTAASPVRTAARSARASSPAFRPRWRTASTRSSAVRTARSASSSWATGAPQTAMTASPMNFSTVPPYRSTISRATWKYPSRNSRTRSGSSPSLRAVKPTRSANRIETRRRSVTAGSAAGLLPCAADRAGVAMAPAAAVPTPPTAGVPHSEQNLAPGRLTAPQAGQLVAKRVPHSEQNLAPTALEVPQLGQVTRDPRCGDRWERTRPRAREWKRPPGDRSAPPG